MSTEVSAVVGKFNDLKDGEMKEVEVGEGRVLLVRDQGTYYAVGNKCTHYAAPLKNGAYSNGKVRCPWHGACFSVTTGDIEDSPGLDSLQKFKVTIQGEDVVVTALPEALTQYKRTRSMCAASSSDSRVFAILGGGAAAAACAEGLRQEGFTGRILMISREKHLPYDRPKLSKAMSIQPDKILLRTNDFYAQNKIEVLLDKVITELDVPSKNITLGDGQTIKYDAALLATGANPRTLPVPGSDASNIFLLRDPKDSAGILKAIEVPDDKVQLDGKRVVIVGSSFIGMETASCIVKKCKSVVVIGMESVPFERVLGVTIGRAMQKLHEDNGICFRLQRVVKEVRTVDGVAKSVLLDNGEVLDADVIVVGAGVIPATQFVKGVTLERDQSIVADKCLKVADGLWAAGDLVRYQYHGTGESCRIEHWGMAQNHGRLAAKNMLGKEQACEYVPYFWTAQYGKNIRYCGLAYSFDDVIVDGKPEEFNFLALFVKGNKVLAAASMNRDPQVSAICSLLESNKMPTVDEIRASKIDFVTYAAHAKA